MEIRDKIVKLAGGGASPAIASYIQVPEPNITAPYSMAGMEQGEEQSLLDDKQRALLYEKGLPSDVEQFLTMINGLGNSVLGGRVNPRQTSIQMSQINGTLNRIAFNKQEYDRVMKEVTSNGGLNEYAISSTGRLIVQDQEGQIKQLTPEEFKKDMDKYMPLTNSDLASLRSLNGSMAFNNGVLNVISNGIGMGKINELLWNTISKIGKTSIQTDKFMSKAQGRVSEGLQELLSETSEDGVYKVGTKQVGQSDKARYALEYLYATSPENAKALLKTKAIAAGMDAKTGAYNLIATLVQSGLTDEISTTIDYDKTATNGANTDAQGNKKTYELGPLTMYQTGKGGQNSLFVLNPGSPYAIKSIGKVYFQPLGNDGNPIQAGTLENMLNKGIGSIGDTDSIYVGNQKIDRVNADKVYFDGSNFGRVELPYVYDANGNIKPNFDILDNYSRAMQAIHALGNNATASNVEEIFREFELDNYLTTDEYGNLVFNPQYIRPFYTTNVLVSNEDDIIDDSSDVLAQNWFTNIKNMYKNYDAVKDKMEQAFAKEGVSYSPDDVYAATAYIPVTESTAAAMIADKKGPTLPGAYTAIDYLTGRYNRDQQNKTFQGASASKIDD